MSFLRFYGNPEGLIAALQRQFNNSAPQWMIDGLYIAITESHWNNFMNYGIGMSRAVGFPLGLLLQILTVLFLVRGKTGFSPSARKWFLLVVGADIAGTLYRTYEMLTVDFELSDPYASEGPGRVLMLLMWGLRKMEHAFLQRVMCRVFFIVISFPLYLSPIALTVSSMIRCYCVKYPLAAKARLTKRLDLSLILGASLLALAISVALGSLVIDGWSNSISTKVLGIDIYQGYCNLPEYTVISSNQSLLGIGFYFMLVVVFLICFLNMLSATVIIVVLFQSRRSRALMSGSANDGGDGVSAEARATARLLGVNVTLLLCFFFSRLLLVVSTKIDNTVDPISYVVSERVSSLLFHVPYFTNSLFIAGLSRRFFEFLIPCLKDSKTKLSSNLTSSLGTV